MPEDLQIKEYLVSLENKLLSAAVRKSAEEIAQLLADDYLEYGSSGKVYNKKDTIEALQSEPVIEISAHDFEVKLLTPEVALVRYIAVKKDKTIIEKETDSLKNKIYIAIKNYKSEIKKISLRSSVWKKTGENW